MLLGDIHYPNSSHSSGINTAGNLNWGTHLCQFYRTKEDLLEILIPFFREGLLNNEFCIWVTSEIITPKEIIKVMRQSINNFDQYLKKGQIEIIPYSKWYLKNGKKFKREIVLNGWIKKSEEVLTKGYAGLRVTGDTLWIEKSLWDDFSDYEREADRNIDRYKIIAVCTYCLDRCSSLEVIDVVSTHHSALINQDGEWRLIESAQHRRLHEALEEQRKLEKRKDEFISVASHELKTPVTTIKGYTQILQQYFSEDEKSSLYLSKMNAQVDRLSELVDELLDVSRIQSGKLNLKKEEFLLDKLIKEIVEDMQHITKTHKIIIEKSLNLKISGDKYRISQILLNLISNAIKYSPKADKIFVRMSKNKSEVVIEVEDFGIGISKGNQERIFDRFFQANNRIRPSFSGLGLGLYISSEIVRAHKGRIWVESEKKKGSTFFFSLPFRKKSKMYE